LTETFSELVISHPHADHYNGLLRCASSGTGGVGRGPLLVDGATFFHPRVPENPEARNLLFRLMALNTVLSGLPETALSSAVVACAAGGIARQPLMRGDAITLAGQPVDVLWPPKTLDARSSSRLQRLVQSYDDLAADAAQQGDEQLLRVLATIRDRWENVEDALYGPTYASSELRERETPPVLDGDLSDDEGIVERERDTADSLRSLRHAITRGANLLSLVLATADRRYAFLGDADASVHGDVASVLVDYELEVLMSAHHGTYFSPELSHLKSRYVISSVGPPLLANVRDEYDRIGMHLRTHRAGDITAWVSDSGTWVVAGSPRP